jgi:universal stress protein A
LKPYSRILAAVDLTEGSRAVVERACDFARASQGTVWLLHVVEFVPIEPMSDSLIPVMQIDDQIIERARKQIANLAQEFGLPASSASVEAGSAKSEILRNTRANNCDLIVLGARERHGLSILIHRTEDSVLHGAPCDVLAVRTR